ncbi:MAG: DUF1571 domain-containing protein [Sediminibacterium sp.]|nr:DUF1571 domain-containing protein [Sediminibacterium sp.]
MDNFRAQKTDYTCKDVISKMITSIKEVKSLKYNLKITERAKKGGFNYYESSVKFNKNPRQIYLYIKGIELLWVQGQNKGKALVKPNSFPYINLNLDPMGSLMRQDQHHTLNEMGYDYFGHIIETSVVKLGTKFNERFTLVGEEKINNRMAYKVIIENKDFSYFSYTIGENESITSIARKFFVSEYMIVEKNRKFKDYFDLLEPGTVIQVPNWYCKTTILWIDSFYFLPISVKIMDDKGLFEEYNYNFLQVNPKFEEGEFTRNYKDYKF